LNSNNNRNECLKGRDHLRARSRLEDNIKVDPKNSDVKWIKLGQDLCSREHGHEPQDSIIGGEFLEQLRNHQFPEKDPASRRVYETMNRNIRTANKFLEM
jgi:hypothetical protein